MIMISKKLCFIVFLMEYRVTAPLVRNRTDNFAYLFASVNIKVAYPYSGKCCSVISFGVLE